MVGSRDFVGLDPDQARRVAGLLRTVAGTAQDAWYDAYLAGCYVEASDVVFPAYETLLELDGESRDLAQVMDRHAELIEAADAGIPEVVFANMLRTLTGVVDELRGGLADAVGAAGTAEEIRADLERRAFGHDGVPSMPRGTADVSAWYAINVAAIVLRELSTPEDVRAYWDSLSGRERNGLIRHVPEAVGFSVLGAGVALSDRQLSNLRWANVHTVFTLEEFLQGDVTIGLKTVAIQIGGEVSLVLSKLSNGDVRMVSMVGGSAGIGASASGTTAEAAAFIGGLFEAQRTFVFDDERAALAAVGDIKTALASDLTIGWDDAKHAPWAVLGPLGTIYGGYRWWSDKKGRSETMRVLDRLYDDSGASRSEGLGVFASFEGEVSQGITSMYGGIDAEVDGGLSLVVYDVDAADRSGAPGQTGVVLSGTLNGDLQGKMPVVSGFPTRLSGAVDVAIDTYVTDDGQTMTTLTMMGQGGAGSTQGIDLGVAKADASIEGVARYTVEMTVVHGPQTNAPLRDLARGIADGRIDPKPFEDLWDGSDVYITRQGGGRVVGEGDVDAGVVSVETQYDVGALRTVESLHKRPGGMMYDQLELERNVDRAD